jgi:hypothetical protein
MIMGSFTTEAGPGGGTDGSGRSVTNQTEDQV